MSTGDFILDELLKQHAEQKEAIQRVRELAIKFEKEDNNGKGFLQYGLASEQILKALDGDSNE